MSEKEELEILRNLLSKLAVYQISYDFAKIQSILHEIRYGYYYNLSNSNETDNYNDIENNRIQSLKRLDLL